MGRVGPRRWWRGASYLVSFDAFCSIPHHRISGVWQLDSLGFEGVAAGGGSASGTTYLSHEIRLGWASSTTESATKIHPPDWLARRRVTRGGIVKMWLQIRIDNSCTKWRCRGSRRGLRSRLGGAALPRGRSPAAGEEPEVCRRRKLPAALRKALARFGGRSPVVGAGRASVESISPHCFKREVAGVAGRDVQQKEEWW